MIGSHTGIHRHTVPSVFALAVLIAMMVIAPLSSPPVRAQGAAPLPDLESGRRVYDETGASLTPGQTASLERQLSDLLMVGADAVVVVRALDTTPEETLEQVEALQQAWVDEAGAD